MSLLDSTIDVRALEHARLLLHPAAERDNRAAAIAAAAAFALAGLGVCVTVITTTLARPAEHASALRPAQ